MAHRSMKVGLLDHLGYGNLGDDGTIVTVKQQIERRWPNTEVVALSLNPFDTEQRLGIPSWQIRRTIPTSEPYIPPVPGKTLQARIKRYLSRHNSLFRVIQQIKAALIDIPRVIFKESLFLFKSYRRASTLDILVICGGGQLLNSWGGPWRFPYTLFKWVLLAKLSGSKCYFINLGAGPLDKGLSKWFIRNALSLSDYVSFRDRQSRKLIHDIGFPRLAPAIADSVYALSIPRTFPVGDLNRGPLTVGVSPMAFCDPNRYFERNQSALQLIYQRAGRV